MVELIWDDHGLVRRMTGVVNADQLDQSAKTLQGDARIDDLRYIIHDFSACTDVTLSADDIENMAVRACFALKKNPRVKIAFVSKHPSVHALAHAFNNAGISKHYSSIFDSIESAKKFVAGKN